MTPQDMQRRLDPSEFAFYFMTETGIEAGDLGDFLKRTATVARREGAELRVLAFENGSLFVIFKAIKKKAKKTAKAANKEFDRAPITTTAAVLVPLIGAIVWAMSPDAAAPLAKASADVMEKHEVTQIQLITVEKNILVMDEDTAAEVRETIRRRRIERMIDRAPELEDFREEIPRLEHDPVHRKFEGSFGVFEGEFHFRPDGYRYFVPVEFLDRAESEKILGDGFLYRVDAYLSFRQRMPDRMVVLKIDRL